MNKELKALERIRNHMSHTAVHWKQDVSMIETALKEKEVQDSVIKTLRGVIVFGQTLPRIKPNKDNGFDVMSTIEINIQRDIENRERELLRQWVLDTCFPKELKALQIIKEKKVNVGWFIFNAHKGYEIFRELLTKEEYELLMEEIL